VGGTLETFVADTGANRSIYPNMRAATSFYRTELNIGTAMGAKSMKSEGVGKLILHAPNGSPMPGFDRVVFAKQVAAKIASVGDMCDEGLVCVFDKYGLRTFKAADVNIEGQVFTHDQRDPKTRLYPLTLFRRNDVKEKKERVYASLALSVVKNEKIEWGDLPQVIDANHSQVFLAKTYKKEGLSDLDLWHGKLGDVGIKHIKKIIPTLVVPKTYRCEFCIQGKIHKFGHSKCAEGERTKYDPGVCLHSDHSGPYVMSQGGQRYSQLFMDAGSGYLWAVRMKKKIGHYEALQQIIADSKAASGKSLQYFQSDGEGVFVAERTTEILLAEKIRHLWGAPNDSNTNPFIERARRTVFEGTCTSLIRSGAPSNMWGEAENHKIFTMNVIPSVEDPDKKGTFVSKKNLLEGNRRPYNLKHLMAFGTAATCYIPIPNREGGKTPGQKRFFHGAIMGYADNMPAYRVWDFKSKCVRQVSFNFTVAHEGFYGFKDKTIWTGPDEKLPELFYPTDDVSAFDFDDEDRWEAEKKFPATREPEILADDSDFELERDFDGGAWAFPEGAGDWSLGELEEKHEPVVAPVPRIEQILPELPIDRLCRD